MIYNIQTYCTYGYWPEDLSRGSTKPILAVCDNPKCGKVRVTSKAAYRSLCLKCAHQKRWNDPLEHDKQSERLTKYYEDPLTHEKKSEEQLKRFEDNPVSDETKEISSTSALKRYEDNPMPDETKEKLSESVKNSVKCKKNVENMRGGNDIVEHHIAYDFKHREALTVKITRSFHGSIHHPKGCKIGERGYSLID